MSNGVLKSGNKAVYPRRQMSLLINTKAACICTVRTMCCQFYLITNLTNMNILCFRGHILWGLFIKDTIFSKITTHVTVVINIPIDVPKEYSMKRKPVWLVGHNIRR